MLRRGSDSLLVISEYGLDAKRYNEKFESITWSECTLRRWLNGEFLQQAFTAQEQSLIKVSSLSDKTGPSADDRMFLLSIDEAESLFPDNSDRAAKPTAYAIKKGACINKNNGNVWWRLRSRGYRDSNAAYVLIDGGIHSYGGRVDDASVSVCPVFRIAI